MRPEGADPTSGRRERIPHAVSPVPRDQPSSISICRFGCQRAALPAATRTTSDMAGLILARSGRLGPRAGSIGASPTDRAVPESTPSAHAAVTAAAHTRVPECVRFPGRSGFRGPVGRRRASRSRGRSIVQFEGLACQFTQVIQVDWPSEHYRCKPQQFDLCHRRGGCHRSERGPSGSRVLMLMPPGWVRSPTCKFPWT